MRRLTFTTRRTREASRRVALRAGGAALALTAALSLAITTSAAQAVVVSDQGSNYGVALEPGTSLPGGVSAVTTSTGCPNDPALTPDLAFLPGSNPLCYHAGGAILPNNETFAITWDAHRSFWSGTRSYVEQFLKDVADGSASGQLSSPYALTTQYTDGSGNRAAYDSKFGGGCIDYGNPNNLPNQNTTCLYGSTVQTGPGNNYGSSCTPSGNSYNFSGPSVNNTCLRDGDIQGEIQSVVTNTGLLTHLDGNRKPLIVVLLPPQVEVCLDNTNGGTLCSANSMASGKFCSYHSHLNVGGTDIAYVVQPWTAETSCDEPDATAIPPNPPVDQLANDVGQRLVSPISQGELAATINPDLNGWYAADGAEINDDNGCTPLGNQLDLVTVGNNTYHLQREFDNAAALETDPNTYFGCAPNVLLNPTFVVPSSISPGDIVLFDGSATASTLLVPNGSYQWNFGDGTPLTYGASVVHSFSASGTYNVTLTVTDRGGNKRSVTETVTIPGPNGQAPPVTTQPAPPVGSPPSTGLSVHVQLSPQSLKSVLNRGIALHVKSNQPANGILTISISRSAAKRAHIKVAPGQANVIIARGTTAGIRNGTSFLSLRLPRKTAAKLRKLGHVTFTIKLKVFAAGSQYKVYDAAGRY